MTSAPMISVVIPTLNREGMLHSLLSYFIEYEKYSCYEVIVIDQSLSTSVEFEKFILQNEALIRHYRVNYKQLTRARNDGVQKAKGSIILFLDDDTVPSPGLLQAHRDAYHGPEIWGCAGMILERWQTPIEKESLPSKELESYLNEKKMNFQLAFPVYAQWARGANMSFLKEKLNLIHGFDTNFWGSSIGEDVDFSLRLINAGGKIQYQPAAKVLHMHSESGGCRSGYHEELHIRSSSFCRAYLRTKTGQFPMLLKNLFLDYRRLILNKNQIKNVFWIIQASYWYFKGVMGGFLRALSVHFGRSGPWRMK